MSILGTHHTALTVSSFETSLEFYTRILGLRLDKTYHLNDQNVYRIFGLMGVRVRCAELKTGRLGRLELFEFDSGAKPAGRPEINSIGIQHIAFYVSDFDEVGKRLQLAGVEILNEPVHLPNGARSFFVRDPDGIILELIESPFPFTMAGKLILRFNRLFVKSGKAGRALAGTTLSKNAR